MSKFPGSKLSDPGSTIHVIISVASGTRQAQDFYQSRLVPILPEHHHHLTESEDTITQLTEDIILNAACRRFERTYLLLSGDGGMSDILNTMLSSRFLEAQYQSQYRKPTIALFPLGTGNALANSLKVDEDGSMGITTYKNGTPRNLPIFNASFSAGSRLLAHEGKDELPLPLDDEYGESCGMWGCVVFSWGLHASLVADSDTAEYRKHGVDRFKLAAKENLFPDDNQGPHRYTGKVSVLEKDGVTWRAVDRKQHVYILATLVSNLEKTFTISPDSKPLDGQLRLVQLGPMSGDEVMEILNKAYDGGKHVEDERVGYEAIEGLRIDFDEDDERWRRVCVDGKIVKVEKGGWVEIRMEKRQVLDVLCL